jgi:putative peptide zinc metalloprotease protein
METVASHHKPPLVDLREDLHLMQGPPLDSGAPTWTLHDPVRNSFYRIGWQEFEMLSRWQPVDAGTLADTINRDTTLDISETEVLELDRFLQINALAIPNRPDTLGLLKARVYKKKPSVVTWLLKNYLFFRIPLVRPDAFLAATLPVARRLVSPVAMILLAAAGLSGLAMAIRQWDAFLNTFLYFFSLNGIFWYAGAIFFSKLLHEFGHAYTSRYYGLHVPTMGVAFLVMWPVLYSDNSEAWKLKSRRSRMLIVASGTLMELALALVATFMWSFLPEGPARSACFVLATTTWVSSLLINLSPFLRFDGYYLLSDFWEMPNLHNRAFALGKWHLRRTFLGLRTPRPERLPRRKERMVIGFAYLTWIYRLVLFLGIAILVYHFFFKALGLLLFAVEMAWFIVLPVSRELTVWWQQRGAMGLNARVLVFLGGLLAVLVILALPVHTRVHVPALLKPGVPTPVYPPFSARLAETAVTDGDHVAKGDLLFRLESPQLTHRIRSLRIRVAQLRLQLDRLRSRSDLIEQQHVIARRLAGSLTELEGGENQVSQMDIIAPVGGVVRDLPEGLLPGRWLNAVQRLAVVVSPAETVMEGYPDENDLYRLAIGQKARFYGEGGDGDPVDGHIRQIDTTSSRILEEPYLASLYGGSLPVRIQKDRMVSDKSLYRVLFTPAEGARLPGGIRRGTIVIEGKPESYATRAWRKLEAVLIRESGF